MLFGASKMFRSVWLVPDDLNPEPAPLWVQFPVPEKNLSRKGWGMGAIFRLA